MATARPPRPPSRRDNDDDEQPPAPPPAALSFRQRRRRRRSSARFWRPSQRELQGEEEDTTNGAAPAEEEDDDPLVDDEASSNSYAHAQRALQLNAENRITARNSWNLQLIDNIDSFLFDNNNNEAGASSDNSDHHPTTAEAPFEVPEPEAAAASSATNNNNVVNFTKASCTLDASVKIYSVRVDDVHLTSYKVLANWHRSSSGKGSSGSNQNQDQDPPNSNNANKTPARTRRANHDNNNYDESTSDQHGGKRTLESNLANITVGSLDAAFDIDPLFSKVSKNGGSGLLLDTLCVSSGGCNLVLDSTCAADKKKLQQDPQEESTILDNMFVDIAALSVVPEIDDDQALVPQLSSLRADLGRLEQEGFVDKSPVGATAAVSSRQPYAADDVEESQADQSIHQEALQRSMHKSAAKSKLQGTPGLLSPLNLDNSILLTEDHDDWGGNAWDDGVDDDDDGDGFAGFAFDDDPPETPQFGGGGFDGGGGDESTAGAFPNGRSVADSTQAGRGSTTGANNNSRHSSTTTGVLIDAIANGSVSIGSNTESESQALHDWFQSQPGWAGATHWKRSSVTAAATTSVSTKKKDATAQKSKKKQKTTRRGGDKDDQAVKVDFSMDPSVHRSKSVVGAGKKRRKPTKSAAADTTDSFQWSRATVNKHSKTSHLLPAMDMGMDLTQLSTLFLRPHTALKTAAASAVVGAVEASPTDHPVKQVDFGVVETWDIGGGGDDDSWGGGDDDGGAGYAFGGDLDDDEDVGHPGYTGEEDDGIRRVEKIHVKYATVAKKVDVKRLKRALWTELEQRLAGRRVDEDVHAENNASVLNESKDDDSITDPVKENAVAAPVSSLSFQQAVENMETSRSQVDVTLPFYFICILHLANEKGLRLESKGLEDFEIFNGQEACDDLSV